VILVWFFHTQTGPHGEKYHMCEPHALVHLDEWTAVGRGPDGYLRNTTHHVDFLWWESFISEEGNLAYHMWAPAYPLAAAEAEG
jgi:hypothetical protein